MTDNHLLLYRIAELMLENEQHVLPVDLLFDDDQIGDFVKSIQIDSPYQQMLFEGVLTESVKDEKLFVSFTVEGYFHYVLGEVIYQKSKDKDAEFLKQFIETVKINGAAEGIKECLIRDIKNNSLTRLISLIDIGGNALQVCTIPLAYSFINIVGNPKTDYQLEQAQKLQIADVINNLFSEPTDNDIKILNMAIDQFKVKQMNQIVSLIYQKINELVQPNNIKKAIIYANSIEHISHNDRIEKLDLLNNFIIEKEDKSASDFYNVLGRQFLIIENYQKAIQWIKKALQLDLKNYGNEHNEIAISYGLLASIWSYKGNYKKAIEYNEKSLEIRLKNLGFYHENTAISYNNLSVAYYNNGDDKKAISYLEKSLDICIKIFGRYHPLIATNYNNSALINNSINDLEMCRGKLEKALAINLKLFGKNHPDTCTSYNNLSMVYINTGDYVKALDCLEKALEISLFVNGTQNSLTEAIYNNIGGVLNSQGLFEKAIDYFKKSLDVNFLLFGEKHLSTANVYENLGDSYKGKGDFEIAINYFQKSMKIKLKILGNKNTEIGLISTKIGNIYKDKEQYFRARKLYQSAYKIFFEILGLTHEYTMLLEKKILDINDL